MHKEKKEMAISLRQQGYSYNFIAKEIGISKSTLHYWLVQVPYTPNDFTVKRLDGARAEAGKRMSRRKVEVFRRAKLRAESLLGKLNKRDLLLLGVGLYIGEGQKNETVGIINSDPRVINLAIRWLQKSFGIGGENLTLAIHLYPDNNMVSCLKFWSKVTGIPLSQFGKTQIDRRQDKRSSKRGKLPHGTAHLRVKALGNKDLGVLLARQIHAMMDKVL